MLILQIRTDDECDYHLRKNLTIVKVRKNNMKHTRILSLLLAMIMVFSLFPVSAFATEAGTPEVVSQQLNLGDDLTLHFYVTAEANTVVNAKVNGKTTAYDLRTMTPNGNGQYVIAVKLAAAQMTEAITLDFLQNDVSVLQKICQSPL